MSTARRLHPVHDIVQPRIEESSCILERCASWEKHRVSLIDGHTGTGWTAFAEGSSGMRLRVPRSNLFRFTYSPKYTWPRRPQAEDERPEVDVARRQLFDDRPEIGLWYWCNPVMGISRKRLPRSHARRRLLFAFREALQSQKLSETGQIADHTALSTSERAFKLRSLEEKPAPIDLTGTLILIPEPSILTAKHEDIKDAAGKLVRYLLREQWMRTPIGPLRTPKIVEP